MATSWNGSHKTFLVPFHTVPLGFPLTSSTPIEAVFAEFHKVHWRARQLLSAIQDALYDLLHCFLPAIVEDSPTILGHVDVCVEQADQGHRSVCRYLPTLMRHL